MELAIDDRRLGALIEESQDLQLDALRDMKATLPDLAEVGQRRHDEVDTDEIRRFNASRRELLLNLGLGAGGLASRGLLAGSFGVLLAGILARPAHGQVPLDIQILQTAASLENLAVATYGAALGLPFIGGDQANATVKTFATITMGQHAEHGKAFNAQARALGGREQTKPNLRFAKLVDEEKPKLTGPVEVVRLAKRLETVATQTYLQNTTQLDDTTTRTLMASVMGVESQHAATLAAVEALLSAPDGAELVQVPFPAAKVSELPAAAGSVAFPVALEPIERDNVAEPQTGAVE